MICCQYCGCPTRRLFDTLCPECRDRVRRHPLDFEAGLHKPARLTLHEVLIRVIAALLAVGGAFWGVLLLAIFHTEGDALRVLAFATIAGPGYLVTAGCFWRSAVCGHSPWRIAVWISSILVQGAWLLTSICIAEPNPATLWWIFAFAASMTGLLMETNHEGSRLMHFSNSIPVIPATEEPSAKSTEVLTNRSAS